MSTRSPLASMPDIFANIVLDKGEKRQEKREGKESERDEGEVVRGNLFEFFNSNLFAIPISLEDRC